MRERGERDLPRADVVDHELQRFRLIDGRERPRAARERVGEAARAHGLRRDGAILRDRDGRLGNGDDVAHARDAAHRIRDEGR